MKGERNERNISLFISPEEVYRLQSGQTIGDRPGVIYPDSTVEVLPLGAVEQDDSLIIGLPAELKGNLYPNGDLQVIIPAITLIDVDITCALLPRDQILTPMTDNIEYVTHTIPEDGVTVYFFSNYSAVPE